MTTTPGRQETPSWTHADERGALRRQRFNEQAVRFSSVLSASAVVLGAVLSVVALLGAGTATTIPAAPVDPLALRSDDTGATVSYETSDIAEVAEPALDLIAYPWKSELPGWTVAFLEPRGKASGYTWSAERKIEVFVKSTDGPDRVARVLAHELGHAVDVSLNTGDERRAWLDERSAPEDTAWWPGSGGPDFETGAGDFAEVFAAWQVGEADFKSRVSLEIDAGDYALMSRLAGGDQ